MSLAIESLETRRLFTAVNAAAGQILIDEGTPTDYDSPAMDQVYNRWSNHGQRWHGDDRQRDDAHVEHRARRDDAHQRDD